MLTAELKIFIAARPGRKRRGLEHTDETAALVAGDEDVLEGSPGDVAHGDCRWVGGSGVVIECGFHDLHRVVARPW